MSFHTIVAKLCSGSFSSGNVPFNNCTRSVRAGVRDGFARELQHGLRGIDGDRASVREHATALLRESRSWQVLFTRLRTGRTGHSAPGVAAPWIRSQAPELQGDKVGILPPPLIQAGLFMG
jgi:hypothetical protein